MKVETPNYIFTTPPDSPNAELNILQKPHAGAPYVSLSVNDPTDVATLKQLLDSVVN